MRPNDICLIFNKKKMLPEPRLEQETHALPLGESRTWRGNSV